MISQIIGYSITILSTICCIWCCVSYFSRRRRVARWRDIEKREATSRRLRLLSNDKQVVLGPPRIPPNHPPPNEPTLFVAASARHYHLFLSHVWGTGQDQMRIVKQRLLEMLPDVSVFLDVDDLKEGKGAEYVDSSSVILILVTDGYFQSPNCMRELLRAVVTRKPILALLESEAKHGGLSSARVREQMDEADGMYERWGLASEVARWGYELPTPQALHEALFASPAVEWTRIGAFQDVSMRLMAQRLLPPSLEKAPVYIMHELVQTKVRLSPPRCMVANPDSGAGGGAAVGFHVYCSKHNPGCVELLREVDKARGQTVSSWHQSTKVRTKTVLRITEDIANLCRVDHMVVYLTARTWTSAARSEAFAAEVLQAMDAEVHLLLAHEMPGMGQEVRDVCDFGDFFKPPDEGGTPAALLARDIYGPIAIPLKGDAWREASMVMVAQGIANTGGTEAPVEAPRKVLRAATGPARGARPANVRSKKVAIESECTEMMSAREEASDASVGHSNLKLDVEMSAHV